MLIICGVLGRRRGSAYEARGGGRLAIGKSLKLLDGSARDEIRKSGFIKRFKRWLSADRKERRLGGIPRYALRFTREIGAATSLVLNRPQSIRKGIVGCAPRTVSNLV